MSSEITRELRAARPTASPALRTRVLTAAEREPVRAPSLFERFAGRRRLLLLVPAAASLAVAIAVVGALNDPLPRENDAATRLDADVADGSSTGQVQRETATTPTPPLAYGGAVTNSSPPEASTDETLAAGAATALGSGPATAKVSAADPGRAQRIGAFLSLRVKNGTALAKASQETISITRSLGGYVVRSDVNSGDTGLAVFSVRVPAAKAQEAIAQLSALGTIITQRVVADDLQGSLDTTAEQLTKLRARLAVIRAKLTDTELDEVERATLRARRDQVAAEIAVLQGQRKAVQAEAAEATIDVELRTSDASDVVPVPSRLSDTLNRALDILAWEAVVVLGLLIVTAPLVLFALLGWFARRVLRARATERMLTAR